MNQGNWADSSSDSLPLHECQHLSTEEVLSIKGRGRTQSDTTEGRGRTQSDTTELTAAAAAEIRS